MAKRNRQPITKEPTYKDFTLYNRTRSKSQDGFYTEMLDKTIDNCEAILSNHNKLNVIRFDLYFTMPEDEEHYVQVEAEEANKYVSRFFKNLKDQMVTWAIPDEKTGKLKNRKLKRNQIAYQSTMEYSTEKLVHFHCYIAYKGLASNVSSKKSGHSGSTLRNQNGDYIGIYQKIVNIWKATAPNGYGRVHFPKYKDRVTRETYNNHFYYIERGSKTFQADIENCIYGLSYLAKVYSKNVAGNENVRRFNNSRSIKRGPTPVELKGSTSQSQEAA